MSYKEGVFVREIAEDEEASVYDYNGRDFHSTYLGWRHAAVCARAL